ncbi:Hypothetical protein FKW44_004559 [Caligus rogercresseyi]|uniref:Uncharacterized protein n=1 Tax=Caligus rogercresseyi TaxID=217165 RepID=A0A7T8HLR9_CALRO|nr:Hypothetical protein FKW44_004559 [Caligus rogercresseyi]
MRRRNLPRKMTYYIILVFECSVQEPQNNQEKKQSKEGLVLLPETPSPVAQRSMFWSPV